MKFGSLFAGIGGLDLGLERAGMECAWQVEIDDFCQRVLTKHWPDVPKYKDVRDVGKENLEAVDLIAGGFPCQPFSVAGKQRGEKDDRHLWPEMLRVITELKPTWVLGENVPGIIPIFLDEAISDLEDQGYTCETFVLPAVAFDAPHRRDRLFILAYRNGGGRIHREAKVKPAERGKQTRNKFISSDSSLANGNSIRHNKLIQGSLLQERKEIAEDKIKSGNRGDGRAEGFGRWLPEPSMGGTPDGFPRWMERHIGRGLSHEESTRATETLRSLWNHDVSQALWGAIGGFDRVQKAEILFAIMREYAGNPNETRILLASKEALENKVRILWKQQRITGSSHRSRHNKQRSGKHTDTMQALSRFLSFDGETNWQISSWEDGVPRVASGIENRVHRLKGLGNAVVPQVAEWIGKRIMEFDESP